MSGNGDGNGNGTGSGYNGVRIPLLVDSALLIAGLIGIGTLWARQENAADSLTRIETRQESRESSQQDILNRLARIEASNGYILQTMGDMRDTLKDRRGP